MKKQIVVIKNNNPVFSNGAHLGWKACLLKMNLKGDHVRTIPVIFGLNKVCH